MTWREWSITGLTTLLVMLFATGSSAVVTSIFTFDDNGNWSIDGGYLLADLEILVPAGSEVVQAYLYASNALGAEFPPGIGPAVILDGTTYTQSAFTQLEFVPFPNPPAGMQSFRADVTSQMIATIGTGRALPFIFPIDSSTSPDGRLTGELLVVIYRNPAEAPRHIELFDGGLLTGGDFVDVNLPGAIDLSIPNFEALLSVGIGFSFGSTQSTEITVDGRQLTLEAGGDDDSGDLLTVGGFGDDPANPNDPTVPNHTDDELYDLGQGNGVDPTPFLTDGSTSFRLDTINPSNDDNVFFVGLNLVLEPDPGNCTAAAGASTIETCGSSVVTLDAPGTVISGCSMPPEYRFVAGAMLLRDWDPAPTFDWLSPMTGTYEVSVRCPTDLTCEDTAVGFVDVLPDVAPPDLGNSLRAIRIASDIDLSWAGAPLATSYSLYRDTDKTTWGLPFVEDMFTLTRLMPNEVPAPPRFYLYRVAGASCSGIEGP